MPWFSSSLKWHLSRRHLRKHCGRIFPGVGVMDVINVTHGTLIVIGSFITFFLFKTFGLDPFLTIPFSMFLLLSLATMPRGTA